MIVSQRNKNRNQQTLSLMMKLPQPAVLEEDAVVAARSALESALADRSRVDVSATSLPTQSDWALPADEQRFLASLVARLRPQHILELGSGTSTQLFARAAALLETPCCITSVEHDPDFRQTTISGLENPPRAGRRVAVQFAPLVLRECGGMLLPVYRLRPHRFATSCPADLILIDGPPAALGGREGTLYQMLDFTRPGTLILLDDANRAEERAVLSRWQDNLGKAVEVTFLPEFSHGMAAILIQERIATSGLWDHRLQLCKQDLQDLIAPGDPFILVDQNCVADKLGRNGNAIPFLERDGQYFGPPVDDAAAIREVERLRAAGAAIIAFVWPAFWWLEHYSGLRDHLRGRYDCVLENDRMVVFDLRP
jgi:predicted O-methyltransferase YrrM